MLHLYTRYFKLMKNYNFVDGIFFSKKEKLNTTVNVENFYKSDPFPHYELNDNKNSILQKGKKNYVLEKIKKLSGSKNKIIEIGSGTCQLSNYLSIGSNNQIYAFDSTLESLKLGKKFADTNKIENINFIYDDILNNSLPEEYFDLVWCSGVLHHTADPYKGFQNICKITKKNGIIVIGLYNSIGRLRTKIRKTLYKFFGEGIIYLLDPIVRKLSKSKNNSLKISAWINDQYKHPQESTHTFMELKKWFETENIYLESFYPNFFEYESGGEMKKPKYTPSLFNSLINQLYILFSKYGSEGGLFIFIGRKI